MSYVDKNLGRILIYALARVEGAHHYDAMKLVDDIVRSSEPVPTLEDVLQRIHTVTL